MFESWGWLEDSLVGLDDYSSLVLIESELLSVVLSDIQQSAVTLNTDIQSVPYEIIFFRYFNTVWCHMMYF